MDSLSSSPSSLFLFDNETLNLLPAAQSLLATTRIRRVCRTQSTQLSLAACVARFDYTMPPLCVCVCVCETSISIFILDYLSGQARWLADWLAGLRPGPERGLLRFPLPFLMPFLLLLLLRALAFFAAPKLLHWQTQTFY